LRQIWVHFRCEVHQIELYNTPLEGAIYTFIHVTSVVEFTPNRAVFYCYLKLRKLSTRKKPIR